MFYTFDQNNSGGSFDRDAHVGDYVIIEANSAEEANRKAINHGIYFDGCYNGVDCDCCGDRWHEVSESDGAYKPMVYGKDAYQVKGFEYGSYIVVHWANGQRGKIKMKVR